MFLKTTPGQNTEFLLPARNAEKTTFLEYLVVILLILYTGHANRFFATGSSLQNPVSFSIPIILSFILALKWRIPINKQFYVLLLGYLFYFAAISVKYNEIRPTFLINNCLLFFIAYATVKALKMNFFRLYEGVMVFLAVIGLGMWFIQTVLGGDSLYNILSSIPSLYKSSYVSGDGLNVLLYSVQPTSMSKQFSFLPPRNCGFAWEPGGFAVLLDMAILMNLFFFKSSKKNRSRFWILTLALITTQSTTGYVILILILLFYYFNKKQQLMIAAWPLVTAFVMFVFSLPFMSEKIISLVRETDQVDIMVESAIGRETSIAPQRFSSFLIAFRDFRDNPILGIGGKAEESWTSKAGASVSTITGLGNLLAQYGIVGFSFFLICSYKSSLFFARSFNYKGKSLFLIIMLFISISYSIILLPLFMSFWMFSMFSPNGIITNE